MGQGTVHWDKELPVRFWGWSIVVLGILPNSINGSSEHLGIFGVHVLYICNFCYVLNFTLPFGELSLVVLVFDLVD